MVVTSLTRRAAARARSARACAVGFAALTAAFLATPAPAAGLNDTGQTNCYDSAGTVISCDTSADDSRYGRDAAATAGVLSKTGGGAAGIVLAAAFPATPTRTAGFDSSRIADDRRALATFNIEA